MVVGNIENALLYQTNEIKPISFSLNENFIDKKLIVLEYQNVDSNDT